MATCRLCPVQRTSMLSSNPRVRWSAATPPRVLTTPLFTRSHRWMVPSAAQETATESLRPPPRAVMGDE